MSFKNALTKLGLVEDTVEVKAKLKMPVPVSVSTVSVEVDSEITKTLKQSLEENKLSGFDYLKFISATEEMKKSFGAPEDGLYKMAYMAAKQVGVDKDSLVKSAQHYVDVLKQDETSFNSEFVTPEEKSIKAKENKIVELQAKVANLRDQASQATKECESLIAEAQEKKTNLESKVTSFQVTLKSFIDNIQNNVVKINKYLS